jgi:hypothetical protein
MLNPAANLMVNFITHSEKLKHRQRSLHRKDKKARWFSIRRLGNSQSDHELLVHNRFNSLCDPTNSGNADTKTHFPSIVSFIGRTSAGKSSLISSMLLMGLAQKQGLISDSGEIPDSNVTKLIQTLENRNGDWPVSRSSVDGQLKDPTTFGVHLYRDGRRTPQRASSNLSEIGARTEQFPLLFADCEGFGAGYAMTNAERNAETDTAVSDTVESSDGDSAVSPVTDESESGCYPRGQRHSAFNGIFRYPIQPSCYNENTKIGVELFYARFLYAMSDIVVYVMNVDSEIRQQLIDVLEWAASSVYKSLNYSTGKSLIIVRHMSNTHKSEYLNPDILSRELLQHTGDLCDDSLILKEFREKFNKSSSVYHRIQDNESLYNALFDEISCRYIPHKDQVSSEPEILVRQWAGLRTKIDLRLQHARTRRRDHHELYNVPDFLHIIQAAFEHFSSSDQPFDFYLASGRANPNPKSMDGHVANFIRHATDYWANHAGASGIDQKIPEMIIDTVLAAMLIWTWRTFEGKRARCRRRKLNPTLLTSHI